jgi:predicted DNA binding CopG/RHH family protein
VKTRQIIWTQNRLVKKKMVGYSEGEMGALKIVKDFLPTPSELVLKDDNVKVTLSLSRRSIEFFKREANRQHVPYQKMIRALEDGKQFRIC